ncbi:hypothetical protein Dimus_002934 [Dionaea muscipula]
MAQTRVLNDRLTILRELECCVEPAIVHRIGELTRINIVDELLNEMDSVYGYSVPKIKYLGTQPKIHYIELGLVNKIWLNCDDVPEDFSTIVKYILKNLIVPTKWLKLKIVSTVASRYMEKFYQPYQIWSIQVLSQNPVRFDGSKCGGESVLEIDPIRYKVDSYRQFLRELNEFKMMYECGVQSPSFFDGIRIVSIDDYRIGLNLLSKLEMPSHKLDMDKFQTFWKVCRMSPNFPDDVITAAAGLTERIENMSLVDFIHPNSKKEVVDGAEGDMVDEVLEHNQEKLVDGCQMQEYEASATDIENSVWHTEILEHDEYMVDHNVEEATDDNIANDESLNTHTCL